MSFDGIEVILLVGVAAFGFFRAVRGYRLGKADWFAGPSLGLTAEREEDPVGFTTAVWGNAFVGALALYVAAWLAFG